MANSIQICSKASWGKTAAVWMASFLLLMAPDAIFQLAGYSIVSIFTAEAVITVGVIALVLTLMPSRTGKLAVIAFATLGQLVWLSCLRYFGGILRPDQVLLVGSEISDTAIGAISEFGTLLPIVALVAAVATGLWSLHLGRFASRLFIVRGTGLLFCVLLLGLAGRWTFWKHSVVAFPGLHTASAIGTYHASVSAIRFALAPAKAAPGLVVREQQFAVTQIPDEPVTILFVMSESINPVRLSLFGASADTSPNLSSWRTDPPEGMHLFSRIGFAGGVATLSSVPSLIRMASIPVEAERRGQNLFELARLNGFNSWYFSSQGQHFLATAGGAPGAVRVETERMNEALIEQKRDDFLVDLVRSVPAEQSPRQLIFVHQRVNHLPYERNCSHVAEAVHIFKTDGLSKDDARRAAYDNGLRCWDRNIAALVEPLIERPGAVHVFITADHNELMGEDGLWGHLHPTLRTSAVPMLLLTNRPKSEVAQQFTAMRPASSYNLSRTVAKALGIEIKQSGTPGNVFYLNKTMPFGMAGYLEVEQRGPWYFKVRSFDRQGNETEPQTIALPELGIAEASAEPLSRLAAHPLPAARLHGANQHDPRNAN